MDGWGNDTFVRCVLLMASPFGIVRRKSLGLLELIIYAPVFGSVHCQLLILVRCLMYSLRSHGSKDLWLP